MHQLQRWDGPGERTEDARLAQVAMLASFRFLPRRHCSAAWGRPPPARATRSVGCATPLPQSRATNLSRDFPSLHLAPRRRRDKRAAMQSGDQRMAP
eukprot:scaffold68901_cov30-Tisochrysis_lutea.AAC.3